MEAHSASSSAYSLSMIAFTSGCLFSTRWVWFSPPHDVEQVDEAVFLDYRAGEYPGFRRKEGVTSVIDLTQSEEALWSAMRDKFIRKQIRRGESLGITVREGALADFAPLYASLRTSKRLPVSDLAPVAVVGRILVAEAPQSGIMSGGLFIGDGTNVRAYALASKRFTARDGHARELIGYGNRMVVWEAMKLFKREGYRALDLGGINPNSGDPEDDSLAEFKEAFGGVRVPYYFYRKTYSSCVRSLRRLRSFLHI